MADLTGRRTAVPQNAAAGGPARLTRLTGLGGGCLQAKAAENRLQASLETTC